MLRLELIGLVQRSTKQLDLVGFESQLASFATAHDVIIPGARHIAFNHLAVAQHEHTRLRRDGRLSPRRADQNEREQQD